MKFARMRIGCIERSAERRLALIRSVESAFQGCRRSGPPVEILPFDPATEEEISFDRTPEICIVGPGYSLDQAAWICCTLKKNYLSSQKGGDSISGRTPPKPLSVFVVVAPSEYEIRSIRQVSRFAAGLLSTDDSPAEFVQKIIEAAPNTDKGLIAPSLDLAREIRPSDLLPAVSKFTRAMESRTLSTAYPHNRQPKFVPPKNLTQPRRLTSGRPLAKMDSSGASAKKNSVKNGPVKILPGVWIRGNEIEHYHRGAGGFTAGCVQGFRKIIEFFELPALTEHRRASSRSIRDNTLGTGGWTQVRGNPDTRWCFNWDSCKFSAKNSDDKMQSAVWLKFSH